MTPSFFGSLPLLLLGSMGLSLAGTEPSGEFHGRRPTSERPLPDFIALNHLGQGRSAADLVGSPTVLWFYPMAGTPG